MQREALNDSKGKGSCGLKVAESESESRSVESDSL